MPRQLPPEKVDFSRSPFEMIQRREDAPQTCFFSGSWSSPSPLLPLQYGHLPPRQMRRSRVRRRIRDPTGTTGQPNPSIISFVQLCLFQSALPLSNLVLPLLIAFPPPLVLPRPPFTPESSESLSPTEETRSKSFDSLSHHRTRRKSGSEIVRGCSSEEGRDESIIVHGVVLGARRVEVRREERRKSGSGEGGSSGG